MSDVCLQDPQVNAFFFLLFFIDGELKTERQRQVHHHPSGSEQFVDPPLLRKELADGQHTDGLPDLLFHFQEAYVKRNPKTVECFLEDLFLGSQWYHCPAAVRR